MAISLDFTGLLRFSAFWVARKGGRSGRRLYLFLYIFFLLCGVIVGNVSTKSLSITSVLMSYFTGSGYSLRYCVFSLFH
jgi:Na+/H+ antiporter NhaD/arsenite permease-like protein